MSVGKMLAQRLVPVSRRMAPRNAAGLMISILDAAIEGRGRVPGAAAFADRRLEATDGDVDQAVSEVIEQHVALAGGQGFLTSLGGIATLPVSLPANLAGLAVLQARMVAAIAHLRGYDLDEIRVRTAICACLLGEETVAELVRQEAIPSSPHAIATAPVHDPALDEKVIAQVGGALLTRVGGKSLGVLVTRRIPLVGGGVGAVVDGASTYQIGRYARRALPSRRG